jgi:hypothetical protein
VLLPSDRKQFHKRPHCQFGGQQGQAENAACLGGVPLAHCGTALGYEDAHSFRDRCNLVSKSLPRLPNTSETLLEFLTCFEHAHTMNFSKNANSQDQDREPLSGLFDRVTFHSAETGFCVLRLKVRGHRELVTALGSAASVQPGEFIQCSGQWDNHRDHGMQFSDRLVDIPDRERR